ncbi:hypothetical protein D3C84_1159640 [compost metagenome]
MFTAGPLSMIVAPWPLLMVIPISLIEIIAPVRVLSRMPPVGPGRSEIVRPFWLPVCNTMLGDTGSPASARAGTSAALPQKPPTQIG